MNHEKERILAFDVVELKRHLDFQGFDRIGTNPYRLWTGPQARVCVDLLDRDLVTLYRDEAEKDVGYKQAITYALLLNGKNEFWSYRRASNSGEPRLANKRSIGVGGHLDADLDYNIESGMWRELMEEIYLPGELQSYLLGFINDDSNEVGKVHFGIVYLIRVGAERIEVRDKTLISDGFMSAQELLQRDRDSNTCGEKAYAWDELENWSRIILQSLIQESTS